ncbi:MAG: O-antigen ligase family protein [Verrucomicrobia bacterium]|nr:O-antigen ligase family protein [Verrucomicrobiota bacterium]
MSAFKEESGGGGVSWRTFAGFFLCAVLLFFFLAGGPRQGASGAFLLISGIGLLLCKPRVSPPWPYWVCSILFLGSLCLAMLPVSILGPTSWRQSLEALPAFHAGSLFSLSPRETAYWIVLMALSLLIGLATLSQPLSGRGLQFLALIAVVGCSAYTVVAMYAWLTGWNYPFFDRDPSVPSCFGFFPSRNQTASLMLTSTIVAVALVLQSFVSRSFITGTIAGISAAILASGVLFFSTSRGGILFLVLGIVIWILGLDRKRFAFALPVFGLVIMVAAVLFLASPQGARDRIFESLAGGRPTADGASEPLPQVLQDGRLMIFADTLSMVADHPMTGSGLGTYEYVYPFYAKKSLSEHTAAHAESDWLTLLEEAGPLALLGAFAFLSLLIGGIRQSRGALSWPLRWGMFSAFLAEVCHGFVDVPAHSPELRWWMLFLATVPVNLAVGRGESAGRFRFQRFLFILAGVFSIFLGGFLIYGQWGGGASMPPYAVDNGLKRLSELNQSVRFQEAADLSESLRVQYPMAWELSYLRGMMLVALGRPVPEAAACFDVENALRPRYAESPYRAGSALANLDSEATLRYWEEALRRRLAIDHSPNCNGARARDLYGSMLTIASKNPSLMEGMYRLLILSSELRLSWLSQRFCTAEQINDAVNDEAWMNSLTSKDLSIVLQLWCRQANQAGIGSFLDAHPDCLDRLSSKEQRRFFEAWWSKGDWPTITAFLRDHPRYDRAAAATRAVIAAATGSPEWACGLLLDTFSIPVPELDLEGTQGIRGGDDSVPDDPLAAARYYIERGNKRAALRLLTEAMRGGDRSEALRLRAVLAMRGEDWKAALNDLLAYLHAKGEL